MRDTIYISYQNSNLKKHDDIMKMMTAYFGQRGVYNEAKEFDSNLFRTTYQNNRFDILSCVFTRTGNCLKVISIEKMNSNSIFSGFIKVIQDFLTLQLNIKYYDIEYFDEENINQIEQTNQFRFLSRKSMCLFLEENQSSPIPIEFMLIDNGQTVIKRGSIQNNQFESNEQAWYSIAKQIDYDDWDMTSASFAPMTSEEFENEILQFAKYWELDESNYTVSTNQNIISILRISKEWNSNAYLIKYGSYLEFIGTNVWTG